jgi:antitoxin YefM
MTAAMTYADARANLASVLDKAVDDREEVIITRTGREAAVVVSLAEWESMKETLYLMASPANYAHLNESIAQLEAGQAVERALIE